MDGVQTFTKEDFHNIKFKMEIQTLVKLNQKHTPHFILGTNKHEKGKSLGQLGRGKKTFLKRKGVT